MLEAHTPDFALPTGLFLRMKTDPGFVDTDFKRVDFLPVLPSSMSGYDMN